MPRNRLRSLLARTLGSLTLLGALAAAGIGLSTWKAEALAASEAAAASQPEPIEAIAAARARPGRHRAETTAIGTVRALRWLTLKNELPGTVREVLFESGQVVEQGQMLIALDVAVEEAELQAAEAGARLAQTLLGRMRRALESQGASAADVDRALAQFDVAQADVERFRAVIERKRVRAPFRARVGLTDVQPGQYLEAGTALTTLQGVESAVHVDFRVGQDVAARIAVGDTVRVGAASGGALVEARISAVDARVDPATRNQTLRALVEDAALLPAPGGSVRVRVPVGAALEAVLVPVSALRKDPAGEHVFVLSEDGAGLLRAHQRRVVSGPVLGDEVLVLEGLAQGEQVAASGSFKLFEGLRVAVLEDATVAAVAAGN